MAANLSAVVYVTYSLVLGSMAFLIILFNIKKIHTQGSGVSSNITIIISVMKQSLDIIPQVKVTHG